ncbi:MAG: NAD-dependent epimerase/dehydratase family protein [Candidatus Marsarchaeota archaeon]|nr:NAD-dependent epimerase/dehydratase family protein [Candidatus Marsarchaeota archaeon]
MVDKLLADGFHVTVIDNLSEGRIDNLKHHQGNSNLTYIRGDIRDAATISDAVKGNDVVFHLAAHANIRTSLVNHRADLEHNLVGTLNILEAMLHHGVRDLVFASTSALYGEASIEPTPESYAPVQTSLYGASKLACEAYAEAYTQLGDVRFWAYRFSNVVGERCRRGVIWDFVTKLRDNPKELEILGDGNQSKEYIYVADCIEGILTGYRNAADRVNIFNLAVEENRTPNDVADIIIREMGLTDVKRRYTGGRRGWIGDNPIVHLDISKLKSLGWKPKFSADEAIKRTAVWAIKEQTSS